MSDGDTADPRPARMLRDATMTGATFGAMGGGVAGLVLGSLLSSGAGVTAVSVALGAALGAVARAAVARRVARGDHALIDVARERPARIAFGPDSFRILHEHGAWIVVDTGGAAHLLDVSTVADDPLEGLARSGRAPAVLQRGGDGYGAASDGVVHLSAVLDGNALPDAAFAADLLGDPADGDRRLTVPAAVVRARLEALASAG